MAVLVFFLTLIAAPVLAQDIDVTAAPYGAVGNGTTDTTAALQSAIDAANPSFQTQRNLVFPAGRYRITDTLQVGCSATNSHYVTASFTGQSMYTTAIVYDGPMNRPAIRFCKAAALKWTQLTVEATGARGDSVGIAFDGPGSSGGTMNTVITFDHCAVSGFHFGILVGMAAEAGSELAYHQCVFSNNDIGWTANGYNSLNFWFYGVHLLNNDVGIKVGGPWATDAPHIVGGSSAGNTVADIECANGFGALTIENFRAEIAPGAKFIKGVGCGHTLSVKGSTIIASCWCATPVMDLAAWMSATVENSVIQGQIQAPDRVDLRIAHTTLYEGAPGLPVLWTDPGWWSWHQRVDFQQNHKINIQPTFEDKHAQWFPNVKGYWTGTELVEE